MNIGDVIAISLILVVVGIATAYIVISKKKGKKCIGCPYGSSCSGKCSSNCSSGKDDTSSKA